MLKTLKRITQQINTTSTLAEALDMMVRLVRDAFKAQACTIYLLDAKKAEYVFMATEGLNQSLRRKIRFPINEGLVGLVGRREEPINLDEASIHPDFLFAPGAGEEKYKAFLGVPIIHHRRLFGVLVVQQEERRFFDESEEAFLLTIALQLAGTIAHAETTGELRELLRHPIDEVEHESTYVGTPGVSGVAIGKAVVVYETEDIEAIPDRKITHTDAEIAMFEGALMEARADMVKLMERMATVLKPEELVLFNVYLQILDHSSFARDVIEYIKKGNWAQGALKQTVKQYIAKFEAMDDEYLKERAADIRDLGRRILSRIRARKPDIIEYPEQTVLLSDEVTASMLAEVPEGRLVGVVSVRGSSNSHAAIIARSMGVPCVMGVQGLDIDKWMNATIIVDGYFGQVYINPSSDLLKEFEKLAAEERELDAKLVALRGLPAETPDGHRVKLYVNTGMVDSGLSMSVGADGIGLYRTEVSFMGKDRFPSEEEQFVLYRQLLKAFAPRPVIMRTLDIGGDKPLPYFPVHEDNPFLGWRGIRITLDHPDVFLVQLRAMLRANFELNNLKILLPMITSVNEVTDSLQLIHQAYQEVVEEGCKVKFPSIGVMIEVPSAIYLAKELANKVDFLSVGSNDLTQYLLAVDRTNMKIANLYDHLHPSLIRALAHVVEAVHTEGKTVGICGEMASDPLAVVLLLALGFDYLSMNAANLPRMKWVIKNFSLNTARKILKNVLTMDDPKMIRFHLQATLDEAGLGGLIRAGKH